MHKSCGSRRHVIATEPRLEPDAGHARPCVFVSRAAKESQGGPGQGRRGARAQAMTILHLPAANFERAQERLLATSQTVAKLALDEHVTRGARDFPCRAGSHWRVLAFRPGVPGQAQSLFGT